MTTRAQIEEKTKKRNEEIRALVAKGVPQYVVAQRYDLHNSHVSRIVNNKSGLFS